MRIQIANASLAIYPLIHNKHEWNNCFNKNNKETLLHLADFTLQKQAEDNLLVSISEAWYNGSYTMAAKPIKSLYYKMIQFLISNVIILCNVLHTHYYNNEISKGPRTKML